MLSSGPMEADTENLRMRNGQVTQEHGAAFKEAQGFRQKTLPARLQSNSLAYSGCQPEEFRQDIISQWHTTCKKKGSRCSCVVRSAKRKGNIPEKHVALVNGVYNGPQESPISHNWGRTGSILPSPSSQTCILSLSMHCPLCLCRSK